MDSPTSPAEARKRYQRWLVAFLLVSLGATCLALIVINKHQNKVKQSAYKNIKQLIN